ncbi:hypothetical protein LEP1GSC133_2277 [Leptospira borgpetersenii serovar Pomona str. 200901868]|uniref:Uncharacterized protein n=1 Tax=Leptospira borgpetersenii serovar Pomona str. 200901868 TaxID=1192866 RepID=M6WN82_LEPBO|nr:hypothetical protein LEP1GSC133_2277 [Leptospira borgpetersenii serovar Pomona str. 200901868]
MALPLIFVFLFEFAFLPVFESRSLFADPFDQNFENKNKAKGRLESYYNAAEKLRTLWNGSRLSKVGNES